MVQYAIFILGNIALLTQKNHHLENNAVSMKTDMFNALIEHLREANYNSPQKDGEYICGCRFSRKTRLFPIFHRQTAANTLDRWSQSIGTFPPWITLSTRKEYTLSKNYYKITLEFDPDYYLASSSMKLSVSLRG